LMHKICFYKRRFCALSWLIAKIILKCTVSKTSKISVGSLGQEPRFESFIFPEYNSESCLVLIRTQFPQYNQPAGIWGKWLNSVREGGKFPSEK